MQHKKQALFNWLKFITNFNDDNFIFLKINWHEIDSKKLIFIDYLILSFLLITYILFQYLLIFVNTN